MNNLIKEAMDNTKHLMLDHYNTLLGERRAGSKWGRDFKELDFGLPWTLTEDVDERLSRPGCQYFKLWNSSEFFPKAKLGAITLGSLTLLPPGEIFVCEGEHGKELAIHENAMNGSHFDKLRALTNEAWLVIGDHMGERVIFTAHPGPLMAPCPKTGNIVIGDLPYETAVKIAKVIKHVVME